MKRSLTHARIPIAIAVIAAAGLCAMAPSAAVAECISGKTVANYIAPPATTTSLGQIVKNDLGVIGFKQAAIKNYGYQNAFFVGEIGGAPVYGAQSYMAAFDVGYQVKAATDPAMRTFELMAALDADYTKAPAPYAFEMATDRGAANAAPELVFTLVEGIQDGKVGSTLLMFVVFDASDQPGPATITAKADVTGATVANSTDSIITAAAGTKDQARFTMAEATGAKHVAPPATKRE